MNYQVLARKWRPKTFGDVVGQEHIVKTLTNAIQSGRTAHAYIFSGGRGLGKTSVARILAKGLNCVNGPTASPCNSCDICIEITSSTSVDVVEIDGASNTGVDDIRELKEDVRYIPLKGRYKVYIIDEVHMLSNSAFNALLKTLEEPPPHVIFIFATTEVHKIPATIISRCQHFNFKRISYHEVTERLRYVAGEEGISLDEKSLSIITRSSEGSMRDALIFLDQVCSYCGKEIKEEDVETILGIVGRERLSEFTKAIANKNAKIGLELIKGLVDNSIDIRIFSREFIEYVRDLIVAKISGDSDILIDRPKENIDLIKKEAGLFTIDELQRLFSIFQQAQDEIARSSYPRFILEVALVKSVKLRPLKPIEQILERISDIEKRISVSTIDYGQDVKNREKANFVHQGDHRENEDLKGGTGGFSSEDKKDKGENYELTGYHPFSWDEILKIIGERRPSLLSYLEKGLLLGMTDTDITLGYADSNFFLAELLNREENIRFIGSVVKELSGREMRIKITKTMNDQKPKEEPSSHDQQPDKKRSKQNQIIMEALNILGGEVVDVRRSEGGR